MGFAAGTTVGPYGIVALLGAGGMGEVYRARDTKLGRDVAIKVIGEAFLADADRIARFEREAKALAALNHPNIASLYGMEDAGGQHFLIMELVEGETLAELIDGSGLPLEQALAIARQIAEALESAHDQGIVHRDLKPANIKVRADGIVKVLDFGLAKMLETGVQRPGLTMSPTLSVQATYAGVILGTASYMSPEQARGKAIDRRSDIWSFGCVLYEMLTGRKCFDAEGDSVSDAIAAILKNEPDWTALPAATPPNIRTLLKRCLQKDPQKRLPHIGLARIEIAEPYVPEPQTAAVPASVAPARTSRMGVRAAWGLAAASTMVAIALGMLAFRAPAMPAPKPLRFSMTPPDGWKLTLAGSETSVPVAGPMPLAVSPDGAKIAFLATGSNGHDRIWLRAFDSLNARELTGTDGASGPFWSPDSRNIGFYADGKIKRVDITGGLPVAVCDSPDYRGGAWGDGVIVFAPTNRSGLLKVAAAGGVPSPATTLAQSESGHARPSFLPDGRHFIYGVYSGGIYIASLDSQDRQLLFKTFDAMNVVYAQGYILFLRGTTLMAQPFDERRLALSGEPVPVAEQVLTAAINPPLGVFSVSTSGVLAYIEGANTSGGQLTWIDRSGKTIATVGERENYGDLSISPDEKHATVSNAPLNGDRDIWLVDLARGVSSRLTFDKGTSVAWSADGKHIFFSSTRKGAGDLYRKAVDGGTDELLFADEQEKYPMDVTPDGKQLLYLSVGGPAGYDLMLLPLAERAEDRKPTPLIQTRFNDGPGHLSPDGRWLAYMSNESGTSEVYIASFPNLTGKTIVSKGGGSGPMWRGDGMEIFYTLSNNKVFGAEIDTRGSAPSVGAPQQLFDVRAGGTRSFIEPAQNGQRFLVNSAPADVGPQAPVTVVVNWPSTLRK